MYLVQVGRIDHVKNYETVLRALPHTSNNIKYIIVGKIIANDPYYQKLQKMIQELSLQNRVIFLGELSGISKYYVIDNSIIMVHMSKSESFGNTVKEALVRGIPCIVANNSNLKYLVHDNITGYLIDTYDHLSLAKKINYIYDNNNHAEYNQLKSNLKKETKSKTWAHTALEVLNLYATHVKK
jgi:glycosyltransferase involved in cell wall biosynthesis